jgi:hypothetical protein
VPLVVKAVALGALTFLVLGSWSRTADGWDCGTFLRRADVPKATTYAEVGNSPWSQCSAMHSQLQMIAGFLAIAVTIAAFLRLSEKSTGSGPARRRPNG